MRKRILWVLSLIFVFFVAFGHALEKFPPQKDLKENRYYEGIREYVNVGSGRVRLISCIAQTRGVEKEEPSGFTIGFEAPKNLDLKDIDIYVEDRLGKSYYMTPVSKRWPKGPNTFQWSHEFAAVRGIGFKDLYGLATPRISAAERIVLPLKFSAGKQVKGVEAYEFVFVASRAGNFKYVIADQSDNEIAGGVFKDQLENWPIIITWPCKGAASGRYLLWLKYVLENGDVVTGSDTYVFYHRN